MTIARTGRTSLFHQIGGQPTLETLVADFCQRMAGNPRFEARFLYRDMTALRAGYVRLFAVLTGGPNPDNVSPAQLHQRVGRVHAAMEITDEDFEAMAGCLAAAVRGAGMRPDQLAIMGAAIETFRPDLVAGHGGTGGA